MAQFAPGPWRVVPDADHAGNRRIAGRAFDAIAKVYADEPVTDDAKALANSAAIAAVPDLIDALQSARVMVEGECTPGFRGDWEQALATIDSALRKAGVL